MRVPRPRASAVLDRRRSELVPDRARHGRQHGAGAERSDIGAVAPVTGFNGTPAALAVQEAWTTPTRGGFSSTSGAETRVTRRYDSERLAAPQSQRHVGASRRRVRPRGVVVTTAADVIDGDTSSLAALAANRGADGESSLREAITAANNSPDWNDVTFGIAGAGVEDDRARLALPAITDPITIDGYSEPARGPTRHRPATTRSC